MFKAIAEMEYVEDNKRVRFSCENDCAFPVVKNALIKFMQNVATIEEQAKANQAQEEQKQDTPVVEDSKVEQLPTEEVTA